MVIIMAKDTEKPALSLVVVIIVLVALILLAGVSILVYLSFKESDTYDILDITPFEEATEDTRPPEADSDYLYIKRENREERIPWPDKLSDIRENYIYGTNYTNPDTDGDGMEDGWEALYAKKDVTGKLMIDPTKPDTFGNPDNDGFDYYPRNDTMRGNGRLDDNDNFTNIEEYAASMINPDTGTFERGPCQGLDPRKEDDLVEIQKRGGFHMAYFLYFDLGEDYQPSSTEKSNSYSRVWFGSEDIRRITTDPASWDTDNDGIDDGYEYQYKYEWKADQIMDIKDSETDSGSKAYGKYSIDPLDPHDGTNDMDIKFELTTNQWYFQPDGLTNVEEYAYRTNPLRWDTDNDTLSDGDELKNYFEDSNMDWNGDGVYDNTTNPRDRDTDKDLMDDAWEQKYGLSPLNSSDRFRDMDGDGLPNALEFAFPNPINMYFQTDPFDWDTDDDGMPDGWEAFNGKLIFKDDVSFGSDEDESDGLVDGLWRVHVCNPMVPDAEKDEDGKFGFTEEGYEIRIDATPDNLTNIQEYEGVPGFRMGTWPWSPDTDKDGLLDGEEMLGGFWGELSEGIWRTTPGTMKYFTNGSASDTDKDYVLSDTGFVLFELDDWEEVNGKQHECVDGIDNDGDGMTDEDDEGINFGEYWKHHDNFSYDFKGINASNSDTDSDGITDGLEVYGWDTGPKIIGDPMSGFGVVQTCPAATDTDQDGIDDLKEIQKVEGWKPWILNPLDPDTDNDGLSDGEEMFTDFWPLTDHDTQDDYDVNGDGMINPVKERNEVDHTNPRLKDTDGDGFPDGWEAEFGFCNDTAIILFYDIWYAEENGFNHTEQINQAKSRGEWIDGVSGVYLINPVDFVLDADQDADRDGLSNMAEFENGTDPLLWDTDKDGLADIWELAFAKWVVGVNGTEGHYNIDPLDPRDGMHDPDMDGVNYTIKGIDDDGDGIADEDPIGNIATDGKDNDEDDLIDGDDPDFDGDADPESNDDDGDCSYLPENLEKNDKTGPGGVGQPDGIPDVLQDRRDNNGDGEDGSPTMWSDHNGNGIVELDEIVPGSYDPLGGGGDNVLGAIADGFDNDGDGLIDEGIDLKIGTDPASDPNDGIDEDPKTYYHAFTNLAEYNLGTIKHGYTYRINTTDPNDPNTDGDPVGLNDGWEIWYTDARFDPDPENWLDPYEDNDSLPRGWEDLFNGSLNLTPRDYHKAHLIRYDYQIENPEQDGLKLYEMGLFFSDKDDTNTNGLLDWEEDPDGDGHNNYQEYTGWSDPLNKDSRPEESNVPDTPPGIREDTIVRSSEPNRVKGSDDVLLKLQPMVVPEEDEALELAAADFSTRKDRATVMINRK